MFLAGVHAAPLLVLVGDGLVDGMVEFVRAAKSLLGEVVPLEVAPGALDGVQFRGVSGQPFNSKPGMARGEWRF